MERSDPGRSPGRIMLWVAAFVLAGLVLTTADATAREAFVIAASPSLKGVLQRLANAFEQTHPGVRVQLYFGSGLDLRQTIAGMENSMVGRYSLGKGPIHLVAPGGDEMLTRLEQKYYILPATTHPYAVDQLVLVVPESLVEGPESLEDMSRRTTRLAVADPSQTRLGTQTAETLRSLGLRESFNGRLDVATDSRGVIDHVLSGQAEAGMIFGDEAVRQQQRLRVVARVEKGYVATVHSMAMERSCPNRPLCMDFLSFLHSAEGQAAVRQAGYAVPAGKP